MSDPYNLLDCEIRRLWARVSLPDENGCMLWLGTIGSNGYGQMASSRYQSHVRTTIRAHRATLHLSEGPPPDATYTAAHSCRNRHCVAPAHLRWATQSDNLSDRVADGTHLRNERHPQAKLTWEQVRAIRQRLAEGQTRRQVATEFALSKAHLRRIAVGECWNEIQAAS